MEWLELSSHHTKTDEIPRLNTRRWARNQRVDDGIDGRVHADNERDENDGSRAQSRRLPKNPCAVSQVLQEKVEADPPALLCGKRQPTLFPGLKVAAIISQTEKTVIVTDISDRR